MTLRGLWTVTGAAYGEKSRRAFSSLPRQRCAVMQHPQDHLGYVKLLYQKGHAAPADTSFHPIHEHIP